MYRYTEVNASLCIGSNLHTVLTRKYCALVWCTNKYIQVLCTGKLQHPSPGPRFQDLGDVERICGLRSPEILRPTNPDHNCPLVLHWLSEDQSPSPRTALLVVVHSTYLLLLYTHRLPFRDMILMLELIYIPHIHTSSRIPIDIYIHCTQTRISFSDSTQVQFTCTSTRNKKLCLQWDSPCLACASVRFHVAKIHPWALEKGSRWWMMMNHHPPPSLSRLHKKYMHIRVLMLMILWACLATFSPFNLFSTNWQPQRAAPDHNSSSRISPAPFSLPLPHPCGDQGSPRKPQSYYILWGGPSGSGGSWPPSPLLPNPLRKHGPDPSFWFFRHYSHRIESLDF